VLLTWLRRRRRRKILARPFPQPWAAILERDLPYYRLLGAADRSELHDWIQIFLAEKRFEGCGGMQIRDEVRLLIAAQACILLLHRKVEPYPLLERILVYPTAFRVPVARSLGGLTLESEENRSGESWDRGLVVLSWDDVQSGAADVHDGHNVVFHEFAHQLDSEGGSANGAPLLRERSQYIAWARVLSFEYEALAKAVAQHHATVLDGYGARSPAEFFAVATECFFERPLALQARHPNLYGQLSAFYSQDPAALMRGAYSSSRSES